MSLFIATSGFWHTLAHFLGLDNLSGPYYGAWSGFVSDVTIPASIASGVFIGVRRVNCHAKGCWRMGHYEVEGTPYKVCRIHHPRVPDTGATVEHIHELYWEKQNGVQS